MTLDEFIKKGYGQYPRNAYVKEKGFKQLYVRWGYHNLGDDTSWCLDLAAIIATRPGSGVFTALVERLRNDYPTTTIYVESVLPRRFAAKLVKLGFTQVSTLPPSFFLRGGS